MCTALFARRASVSLLLASALALGSCGDTLQDQPIGAAPLESVIVKSRFPVYWLGLSFSGLGITGVTIDPGGSVTIQYGDCQVGGQYTCVPPLSIVTSPDNSFLPGGAAASSQIALRGVRASGTSGGTALTIGTGGVVVSIYAHKPSLALEAARAMAPLNQTGSPEAPLPRAAPDTGFDRLPLPSQVPPGATLPR